MKTLDFNQMENVAGGSRAGCAVGVIGGFAVFAASMIVAAPTAGAATIAVGGWYLSVLGGCLL